MNKLIKRKYYKRDYRYSLPDEILDMLKIILAMRGLIEKSYVRSAINICRYYKVFGSLSIEKYNAIKRIAVFCGFYD